MAAFCGVSLGPRMTAAGFPGRRWTRKKEATETKKMMMSRRTNRLAMYLPTPSVPPSVSSTCLDVRGYPFLRGPVSYYAPVPEAFPPLTGRLRTVVGVAVAVIVALGIFLRFFTHSALWLDEALTVNRARLPLSQIAGSVKQDGAPPLYYYLLHFWMRIFGQSDLATRSLSGVIGVVSLPVAWLAGNRFGGRFGGRVTAWTTVVLLCQRPVRGVLLDRGAHVLLVILLTGCGFLALHRALQQPRPGNLIATAVVTAALLYTQYWALYLVGVVGLWLLWSALWSRHLDRGGTGVEAPVRRVLGHGGGVRPVRALAADLHLPVPLHRDAVGGPAQLRRGDQRGDRLHRQSGLPVDRRDRSGPPAGADLLRHVRPGAVRVGRSGRIIELDVHTQPRARGMSIAVVGTLFAAIAGGILTSSAFSPRYAAVVFLPLLLLVALGTTTFLEYAGPPRHRGHRRGGGFHRLGAEHHDPAHAGPPGGRRHRRPRQAGRHHRLLPRPTRPGHLPGRSHDPGDYTMVTFPRGTGPQFVDWVNYAKRRHSSQRERLRRQAGRGGRDRAPDLAGVAARLPDLRRQVRALAAALLAAPHLGGHNWVAPNGAKYYEPMTSPSTRRSPADGRPSRSPAGWRGPHARRSCRSCWPGWSCWGSWRWPTSSSTARDPATVGVAARVHEGLLGWDAGFYETIARVGYAALGNQSLRFFPAVPALTHAVAWLPGVGDGAALLVVSNVAAFVATVLLFVLVRRETGDAMVARRAIWFLSLGPGRVRPGHGLRRVDPAVPGDRLLPGPAPDARDGSGPGHAPLRRPTSPWPGCWVPGRAHPAHRRAAGPGGGGRAGAVVDPAGPRPRLAGLGATAAPLVGLLAFGLWAHHEVGDFWAPLRVQFQSTHHGALADPFVTARTTTCGALFHGHVGTALHVPWVVAGPGPAGGLLAPPPGALHRLRGRGPGSWPLSGTNLDSFERYALSAFPLSHGGRPDLPEARRRAGVLVLLPAALAGYALLAFLNISVP